jgi:hypothetical protein
VTVTTTFQYLSTAFAVGVVQARPMLYEPSGTTVEPPCVWKVLKEKSGTPTTRPAGLPPVATAVAPFTYLAPVVLNRGRRSAAPVPMGTGPVLFQVSADGSTLTGTM